MWWLDVVVVLLIIGGVYAFVVAVRARTARMSSHTDRTAEQDYERFADPVPWRRRRLLRFRRDRG